MTVKNIAKLVNAEIVYVEDENSTINMVCSSDLMSDVLTLEPENALLVTGLANAQTIRTAEMSDIDHILFVRNKDITDNMKKLAEESGISLLRTGLGMYEACGVLYQKGFKPGYSEER